MQYDTYKHHITIKLINMNIYIYNMYKHHIYIYHMIHVNMHKHVSFGRQTTLLTVLAAVQICASALDCGTRFAPLCRSIVQLGLRDCARNRVRRIWKPILCSRILKPEGSGLCKQSSHIVQCNYRVYLGFVQGLFRFVQDSFTIC